MLGQPTAEEVRRAEAVGAIATRGTLFGIDAGGSSLWDPAQPTSTLTRETFERGVEALRRQHRQYQERLRRAAEKQQRYGYPVCTCRERGHVFVLPQDAIDRMDEDLRAIGWPEDRCFMCGGWFVDEGEA